MSQIYNLNVLVMRHPLEGSPQRLADYMDMNVRVRNKHRPVIINGGDGSHDHPTQAMLDHLWIYTKHFVDPDGNPLKRGLNRNNVFTGVTFYITGDSLTGRTGVANARALSKFTGNRIVLVGPESIRMTKQTVSSLQRRGLEVDVIESVPEALADAKKQEVPIIYATRLQEERLDPRIVGPVRDAVYLSKNLFEEAGLLGDPKFLIGHPLPEKGSHLDIDADLEETVNFGAFDEAEMGPYVRAAIMGLTTGVISMRKDNDTKWFDVRKELEDHPKFTQVDRGEKDPNKGNVFYEIGCHLADHGTEIAETALQRLKEGLGFKEVFSKALWELYETTKPELWRHLTFRFIRGEDGTVIDHVNNGLTGNLKFNLDLSNRISDEGCDGYPVVISAVDGLPSGPEHNGKRNKRKGVVKTRGVILEPDCLYEYGVLSPDLTLTHIRDGEVAAKYEPTVARVLENFIDCTNIRCISRPEYTSNARPTFYRPEGTRGFTCRYCDTVVREDQVFKQLIKGA